MSSKDDIDSQLNELLPQTQDSERSSPDEPQLEGTFQALSSLGGYLGVYDDLTNPSKEDLVEVLYERGVRNSADDSVYDFLQIQGDSTIGFIRSKNGEWQEQDVTDFTATDLSGTYGELSKLASFFKLYDRYGLDGPSAKKLRQALANFGVEDVADKPNAYVATIEDDNGTEHTIGVQTGEVTTAYPIDSDGNRIGDDEYTSDLLPKLLSRIESSTGETLSTPEQFPPALPDEAGNLLQNEEVAETYQLIMHRIAEQAAGDDVSDDVRAKKVAEARFITEVMSGERTWE